ncbi:MAG: ribonuclease J [Oscillospiraceae bacterium]|nr:ribonuclease J [Oscillospiraceae bacterium]MBQ5324216.1 ribonuclease J [Oscillospiraceae bacterium]
MEKNNKNPKRKYSRKPKTQKVKENIRIVPLGGLGEIGKNMTVFECREDKFIIDCGLSFPDSEMFGVDLVIPDFSYVIENKDSIRGIVITHGHEDHIGSLPYLLRDISLPIYATPLTKGLIENKLSEHSLEHMVQINEIQPGDRIQFGCMTVVPIHVNHSIPDAVGFAIESPAGTVITTGDFKIDYTPPQGQTTDLATFAEYGKKGVLAFMADSTNAERLGFSASEKTVANSLKPLFERASSKRIVIATFASNIYRLQTIFDLAVQHKRKVAVSGRSMVKNIEMALKLGYLNVPEGVIIEAEMVNKYQPEQIVLITTGSQGEPLSALSRMSGGTHRQFSVGKGDFIIISATPIPGNEKMVTKVINGLMKLGAEVIYESMYDVHVSGHAAQEELKLMLNLVKPKYFIPIHGEYKHLKKHALLAQGAGIDENNIVIADLGGVITVNEDSIRVDQSVTAGQIFVDGLGVGDVGSVVLRDRRHLSQDGLVVVVFTVDRASGELLSGPDIVSRGFVYVKESEQLIGEARQKARSVLEKYQGYEYKDWTVIKAKIREQVSHVLYQKTKRSPMVLPIVMEI